MIYNKKYKRFIFILALCLSLGLAVFFVLKALEEKIVFFYTPSNLFENENDSTGYIRVGGLVKENTINFSEDGTKINFVITDNQHSVNVEYKGLLPDLFREKQGVVAEGSFNNENNIFIAKKVLAKHDENYMPPEVKKALERKN